MTTLKIKDLVATEELDRKAMSAVRGGTSKGLSSCYNWGPSMSISKDDFSFNASQALGQEQNTLVNNGNNAAFVSGITSNVTPTQNGTNKINFG
ncbi:MAG TPA: hypothetical protein VJ698_07365 [Noviherbaspirillum sp.]|uniref:hypothetical protein n=1 Tax=Noviherbaspirillum sp. TaxID=1926288 RepID=UPI002B494EE3|nr:hypothetical protein [Noviherbaspirillum sp.]HJV85280.1 hypothetical protein [Noviherbaspirillum sp.]